MEPVMAQPLQGLPAAVTAVHLILSEDMGIAPLIGKSNSQIVLLSYGLRMGGSRSSEGQMSKYSFIVNRTYVLVKGEKGRFLGVMWPTMPTER
jgi:hypothetical protein